jgi:hypothetical protein
MAYPACPMCGGPHFFIFFDLENLKCNIYYIWCPFFIPFHNCLLHDETNKTRSHLAMF